MRLPGGVAPVVPAAPQRRVRHRAPLTLPPLWTIVLAAVLLANLPSLVGLVNVDPLYTLSGLGTGHPGLLRGQASIDPNNGFTLQSLGHLAASDWIHGRAPWWNPFEGVGAPLAAEMQCAALFPLVLLLLLPQGLLVLHLTLEVIAGLATLALLRRLGVRPLISVAAAAAFALNGTFAWLGNAAADPVAFLPLAVLGVELCRQRARWGPAVLTAGLVLSIYSGFPETAAIDAAFAAVWALGRWPRARGGGPAGRRAAAGYLGWLGASAVTALLLCAPLLLPFLGYLGHAGVGSHTSSIAAAAISPAGLSSVGFPYLFGPIFGYNDPTGTVSNVWGNIGGYVTFGALLLAGVGLLARTGTRGLRAALAVWIALCLGRSFGFVPAERVLSVVPYLRVSAFYRYSAPSYELAFLVLAAFGLEGLARGMARRAALVGIGIGLAVATVGLWQAKTVVQLLGSQPGYSRFPLVSLAVALATLLLAALLILLARGRAGALLAGLLAVEALLAFAAPQLSAPRHPRADLGPVHYLRRHLGPYRFYSLGPLAPDYGAFYGLSSLNLVDLPDPAPWASYVTGSLAANALPQQFVGQARAPGPTPLAQVEAHLSAYEQAGVAYLVAPTGLPVPASWPVVYQDPIATIHALPAPVPLFSVPPGTPCALTAPTRATVRVACSQPALVRFDELAFPGWSASVDGRRTPVVATPGVFQSVRVGAGTHQVAFRYWPPHETAALDLLVLGLLASSVGLRQARRARVQNSGRGGAEQG